MARTQLDLNFFERSAIENPWPLYDEMRAAAVLLLAAGYDTTAKLLSNALLAFAENPDQRALLAADPDLMHVTSSASPFSEAAALWGHVVDASARLPDKVFAADSPDSVAARLFQYWQAGCTEFMLAPASQGAGYPDQVELLATEVLPRLREFSAKEGRA